MSEGTPPPAPQGGLLLSARQSILKRIGGRRGFFPAQAPLLEKGKTSSASSSGARASSGDRRKSVHHTNFVGKTLTGSGGDEEHIAMCLQAGMRALSQKIADAAQTSKEPLASAATRGSGGGGGGGPVEPTIRASYQVKGVATEMEAFAPKTFASIRSAFGIQEATHQLTLSGPGGYKDMRYLDVADAAGKSQSWFLIVGDMRYMLKTCSAKEAALLLEVLPDYLQHVRDADNSLLPRFYGLYRIEQADCESRFVVMGNVFAARHPITARFDIKGSTANRKASTKELAKGVQATLKDIDFLQRGRPLSLAAGNQALDYLLDMVEADSMWLNRHGLIDYSMMIGLAVRPMGDPTTFGRHTVEAVTLHPRKAGDPNLMYIGIIDILTRWSFIKRLEALLGQCLRRDISCKPPAEYAERFRGFIRYILRSKDAGGGDFFAEDFERGWLERKHNNVMPGPRPDGADAGDGNGDIEMSARPPSLAEDEQ